MRPYALDSDNAIELLTTIKSCEWNFDFVDPMSLSKLTKGCFDSYITIHVRKYDEPTTRLCLFASGIKSADGMTHNLYL